MDVFTMGNTCHNRRVIEKLKFVEGTSEDNYYLYNMDAPSLQPPQVGYTML